MVLKRFINHCIKWNAWKKHSRNSWHHKICVFFRPKISPIYQAFVTSKEYLEIINSFVKGIHDGMGGT